MKHSGSGNDDRTLSLCHIQIYVKMVERVELEKICNDLHETLQNRFALILFHPTCLRFGGNPSQHGVWLECAVNSYRH